jgi:hypothetical protein
MGDTTPTLPPPSKGCGTMGMILMVVVAIAATVATAGALATAAGASGGIWSAGMTALSAGFTTAGVTTAAGALGATGFALAGAAGSVASQLVGLATGNQEKFSWKQVGLSALGSVASGAVAGSDLIKGLKLGNVSEAMVRGAVSSTISQGVGKALGWQESFSWKSVAASAVGAGVGQAVGDALGRTLPANAVGKFATRFASGLAAGTTTALLRGGRVAVQQVAVDAFGNALGESIVRGITSGASQQEAKAPTYNDGDVGRSELRYATGPISNETRTNAEAFYGALVGMMGQEPAPRDSSNDVLLADASRLSLSSRGDTSAEVAISNRKAWMDTIDRLQRQNAMIAGGIAAVQDFKAGIGRGGVGSGTGPRGSGELNASYAYQQGWGDIRETVTPMSAINQAGYVDDHYAGEYMPSAAQTQTQTFAPMAMDWFEPGMVGGLGVGIGAPNFSLATPLPSNLVLPVNNGYWTNPARPGNSGWVSSHPNVNAVTGGRPVQFRNGMVNFSPWSQGTIFVPNMTGRVNGTGNDLQLGRDMLREKFGLSSDNAAKEWLRQRNLTLHHAADGVRLELIPSDLHNTARGGIPHAGGSTILRNWDYSQGTPMQFYNANRIAAGARYVGAAGMAYGAYADASSLYGEYQISQQSGNYANTINEATRIAGGWTGAWAVGAAGAQFGAGFGTAFGPVGTVVGGIVGGAIGGVLGYAGGSYAAPRVVYDIKNIF